MEHGDRQHLDLLIEKLNAATNQGYVLERMYGQHYSVSSNFGRDYLFGGTGIKAKDVATALEAILDVLRHIPEAEARSAAYFEAKNLVRTGQPITEAQHRMTQDAGPFLAGGLGGPAYDGRKVTVRIAK